MFFFLIREVLQSVQGVNAVFERWKHLLENTNTVGNKDFEWNSEEIKRIISETEEDLDMLQRSVGKEKKSSFLSFFFFEKF